MLSADRFFVNLEKLVIIRVANMQIAERFTVLAQFLFFNFYSKSIL